MARIAGVDLPRAKRIEVALTYIYGVGRHTARLILEESGVGPSVRTDDLTDEQISAIRQVIEQGYKVEGDLRRDIQMSIKRLMDRVRDIVREGRGWSLAQTIQELNPLLRGWATYFRLSLQRRRMQTLDAWVRRRLRCLLWRQWKRPWTRRRKMVALGIGPERAWKSSVNGHGPWWNAGASHVKQALPNVYFRSKGLVSIHDTVDRLQRIV